MLTKLNQISLSTLKQPKHQETNLTTKLKTGPKKEEKSDNNTKKLSNSAWKTSTTMHQDQDIQEALTSPTTIKLLKPGEMPLNLMKNLVMKSLKTSKNTSKRLHQQKLLLETPLEPTGKLKEMLTSIQLKLSFKSSKLQPLLKSRLRSQRLLLLMLKQLK